MLKKLLGVCLILSFGMLLIAGCEANPKSSPDKQCPKTCAKNWHKSCHAKMCKCGGKCTGDFYVRCPGGKMRPCCGIKCAKACAAKCQGTTIVTMKCPCGAKGKADFSKMVGGVEQHYCSEKCLKMTSQKSKG